MNRNIYLLVIVVLGSMFLSFKETHCLFERIEISYDIEKVVLNNKVSYNLNITAHTDEKVKISLYKEQVHPKNLIAVIDSPTNNKHQFNNLLKNKYHVVVYASDKKGGFETIIIGNSNISEK